VQEGPNAPQLVFTAAVWDFVVQVTLELGQELVGGVVARDKGVHSHERHHHKMNAGLLVGSESFRHGSDDIKLWNQRLKDLKLGLGRGSFDQLLDDVGVSIPFVDDLQKCRLESEDGAHRHAHAVPASLDGLNDLGVVDAHFLANLAQQSASFAAFVSASRQLLALLNDSLNGVLESVFCGVVDDMSDASQVLINARAISSGLQHHGGRVGHCHHPEVFGLARNPVDLLSEHFFDVVGVMRVGKRRNFADDLKQTIKTIKFKC